MRGDKAKIEAMRQQLCKLFGLPEDKVQVERTHTGFRARVDVSYICFTFKIMMRLPAIFGTEDLDFSNEFQTGRMLSDVTPLSDTNELIIEATLE